MYIADAHWCEGISGRFDFADDANPEHWNLVDYTQMDILLIGPIGVQSDGSLGIVGIDHTFAKEVQPWMGCSNLTAGGVVANLSFGSLEPRFARVVAKARRDNPGIDIRVSVWWTASCNGRSTEWGDSLSCALSGADDFASFARSARSFLEAWHLQGLDIDYESANVFAGFPAVAASLHDVFASEYVLSVSAARVDYLREVVGHVDEVFMQTYAGGWWLSARDFLELGFAPRSLFYGLCPETDCDGPSLVVAAAAVAQDDLGGTHLWRLNSDNHAAERAMQAEAHALMRGG